MHPITTSIGLGTPPGWWCMSNSWNYQDRKLQPECWGFVCQTNTRRNGWTRINSHCRCCKGRQIWRFYVYIQEFRNSPPFIMESYLKAWCHACYLAAACGFLMPLKCSEMMEVCTPSKVNKCFCYLKLSFPCSSFATRWFFLDSVVICNFREQVEPLWACNL